MPPTPEEPDDSFTGLGLDPPGAVVVVVDAVDGGVLTLIPGLLPVFPSTPSSIESRVLMGCRGASSGGIEFLLDFVGVVMTGELGDDDILPVEAPVMVL